MLEAHETLAERRRHAESIADEFFEGFEAVERIDRPAVSVFGSARALEGTSPTSRPARPAVSSAQAGWAVVTGGGPGVMEAANRGCQEGGGLSRRLQHRAAARAGRESATSTSR